MPPAAVTKPTFLEERALLMRGITLIAGVDEAGTGAWAGPVYAAAVIFPLDSRLSLVRDSKTLSPAQRARLVVEIKSVAVGWAVGTATVEEVAALNVREAGLLAMRRAVEALPVRPEHLLVDAFRIKGTDIPQKSIIRGDLHVKSIAAASVIAKTERDAHMVALAELHPGYGFESHKGYGTAAHQAALERLGPCPAHRLGYAPLRRLAADRAGSGELVAGV